MSIRPLTYIGDPVLRTPAKALKDSWFEKKKTAALLSDMIDTMRKANGVGLAANQIGSSERAFVLECRENPRYPGRHSIPLEIYLNARIIKYSKKTEKDWEGCLSIPHYRGIVPRAREIVLEAVLPDGQKIRRTYKDFHARIIQHEVDHLNGMFYIDRMADLKQWVHLDAFNRFAGTKLKA